MANTKDMQKKRINTNMRHINLKIVLFSIIFLLFLSLSYANSDAYAAVNDFRFVQHNITTALEGSDILAMTSGDFDEDGKMDFIAATENGDIIVYKNNGAAYDYSINRTVYSFTEMIADHSATSIFSISAYDQNEDGHLDFIAGSQMGTIYIYYGYGNGSFYERSSLIVDPQMNNMVGTTVGDFGTICPGIPDGTRDGKLDIVAGLEQVSVIRIYCNQGGGGFSSGRQVVDSTVSPYGLTSGKYFGYSDNEWFIVGGTEGYVPIYNLSGYQIFSDDSQHDVFAMTTADLDMDEHLDFFAASLTGVTSIYYFRQSSFSDGFVTGAGESLINLPHTIHSMSSGDYDGDGDIDFVVGSNLGKIMVIENSFHAGFVVETYDAQPYRFDNLGTRYIEQENGNYDYEYLDMDYRINHPIYDYTRLNTEFKWNSTHFKHNDTRYTAYYTGKQIDFKLDLKYGTDLYYIINNDGYNSVDVWKIVCPPSSNCYWSQVKNDYTGTTARIENGRMYINDIIAVTRDLGEPINGTEDIKILYRLSLNMSKDFTDSEINVTTGSQIYDSTTYPTSKFLTGDVNNYPGAENVENPASYYYGKLFHQEFISFKNYTTITIIVDPPDPFDFIAKSLYVYNYNDHVDYPAPISQKTVYYNRNNLKVDPNPSYPEEFYVNFEVQSTFDRSMYPEARVEVNHTNRSRADYGYSMTYYFDPYETLTYSFGSNYYIGDPIDWYNYIGKPPGMTPNHNLTILWNISAYMNPRDGYYDIEETNYNNNDLFTWLNVTYVNDTSDIYITNFYANPTTLTENSETTSSGTNFYITVNNKGNYSGYLDDWLVDVNNSARNLANDARMYFDKDILVGVPSSDSGSYNYLLGDCYDRSQGTYHYSVRIPSYDILESLDIDQSNNFYYYGGIITVLPSQVELRVDEPSTRIYPQCQNVDTVDSLSYGNFGHRRIRTDFMVCNEGGYNAGSFGVKLYNISNGYTFDTQTISSLVNHTCGSTFYMEASNVDFNTRLAAKVDYNNQIAEKWEANNDMTFTNYRWMEPRLGASGKQATIEFAHCGESEESTFFDGGDTITASVWIYNYDYMTTDPFDVVWYLDNVEVERNHTQLSYSSGRTYCSYGNLDCNEVTFPGARCFEYQFSAPSAVGGHTIKFSIDPDDVIHNEVETNNNNSRPFTIKSTGWDADVMFEDTIRRGYHTRVNLSVENKGNFPLSIYGMYAKLIDGDGNIISDLAAKEFRHVGYIDYGYGPTLIDPGDSFELSGALSNPGFPEPSYTPGECTVGYTMDCMYFGYCTILPCSDFFVLNGTTGFTIPIATTYDAFYLFNGNADDLTGNHHGTFGGDAQTIDTDPQRKRVLKLDGYMDIVTASPIMSGNTAAYGAWVKFDSLPNRSDSDLNDDVDILSQYGTGLNGYALYLDDGYYVKCWDSYSTAGYFQPEIGEWHHYMCVHDGVEMILYVDGIDEGSRSSTYSVLSTANFIIGSTNSSLNHTFNGSIDDVVVYNTALTPTQVKDIFDNQTSYMDGRNMTFLIPEDVPIGSKIKAGLDVVKPYYEIPWTEYTDVGTLPMNTCVRNPSFENGQAYWNGWNVAHLGGQPSFANDPTSGGCSGCGSKVLDSRPASGYPSSGLLVSDPFTIYSKNITYQARTGTYSCLFRVKLNFTDPTVNWYDDHSYGVMTPWTEKVFDVEDYVGKEVQIIIEDYRTYNNVNEWGQWDNFQCKNYAIYTTPLSIDARYMYTEIWMKDGAYAIRNDSGQFGDFHDCKGFCELKEIVPGETRDILVLGEEANNTRFFYHEIIELVSNPVVDAPPPMGIIVEQIGDNPDELRPSYWERVNFSITNNDIVARTMKGLYYELLNGAGDIVYTLKKNLTDIIIPPNSVKNITDNIYVPPDVPVGTDFRLRAQRMYTLNDKIWARNRGDIWAQSRGIEVADDQLPANYIYDPDALTEDTDIRGWGYVNINNDYSTYDYYRKLIWITNTTWKAEAWLDTDDTYGYGGCIDDNELRAWVNGDRLVEPFCCSCYYCTCDYADLTRGWFPIIEHIVPGSTNSFTQFGGFINNEYFFYGYSQEGHDKYEVNFYEIFDSVKIDGAVISAVPSFEMRIDGVGETEGMLRQGYEEPVNITLIHRDDDNFTVQFIEYSLLFNLQRGGSPQLIDYYLETLKKPIVFEGIGDVSRVDYIYIPEYIPLGAQLKAKVEWLRYLSDDVWLRNSESNDSDVRDINLDDSDWVDIDKTETACKDLDAYSTCDDDYSYFRKNFWIDEDMLRAELNYKSTESTSPDLWANSGSNVLPDLKYYYSGYKRIWGHMGDYINEDASNFIAANSRKTTTYYDGIGKFDDLNLRTYHYIEDIQGQVIQDTEHALFIKFGKAGGQGDYGGYELTEMPVIPNTTEHVMIEIENNFYNWKKIILTLSVRGQGENQTLNTSTLYILPNDVIRMFQDIDIPVIAPPAFLELQAQVLEPFPDYIWSRTQFSNDTANEDVTNHDDSKWGLLDLPVYKSISEGAAFMRKLFGLENSATPYLMGSESSVKIDGQAVSLGTSTTIRMTEYECCLEEMEQFTPGYNGFEDCLADNCNQGYFSTQWWYKYPMESSTMMFNRYQSNLIDYYQHLISVKGIYTSNPRDSMKMMFIKDIDIQYMDLYFEDYFKNYYDHFTFKVTNNGGYDAEDVLIWITINKTSSSGRENYTYLRVDLPAGVTEYVSVPWNIINGYFKPPLKELRIEIDPFWKVVETTKEDNFMTKFDVPEVNCGNALPNAPEQCDDGYSEDVCLVLSDMISYYKFDGDTMDIANLNNGDLIEDAAIIDDNERDFVLSLDGDKDFVSVDYRPTLNVNNQVSVMAWVKSLGSGYIVAKEGITDFLFFDDFNGTNGMNLVSHTPDNGTGWTVGYSDGGGNPILYYSVFDCWYCYPPYIDETNYLTYNIGYTDDGYVAVINDILPSADYNVTADIVSIYSGSRPITLVARWLNSANTYAWKFSPTAGATYNKLFKKVGGTVVNLNTSCGYIYSNENVTLEVLGNKITAYRNGNALCTATDNSFTLPGKAGIGMGAFENTLDDLYYQEVESFTITSDFPVDKVPFALSTHEGGKFAIINNKIEYSVTAGADINDGEWHHIAGIYNGTAMVIYVDGVLKDTSFAYSGALPVNTKDLWIGRHYDPIATSGFLGGRIDNVMIYDRAITEAELLQNFELHAGITSCTTNSDSEPNACRSNCVNPSCGDGVTDNGEDCDNGGLCAGDGATFCTLDPNCEIVGGACNPMDGDGCPATCQVAGCYPSPFNNWCIENCTDGVDNNDDTLTDGADPYCYFSGQLDCDDVPSDDSIPCPTTPQTLVCSDPQYSACAYCINPDATEFLGDLTDNDCDMDLDNSFDMDPMTGVDCNDLDLEFAPGCFVYINTMGISESPVSPTYGDYIQNRTIIDNIKIGGYIVSQNVQAYYLGDSGIASTGCNNVAGVNLSQAANTQCSYTSGDTIDCSIWLDNGFGYFEKPMSFYGCAKVDGAWYQSPAEYLIVDSLCGDAQIYVNGSDNLAGTADDEECESNSDCSAGFKCYSCKCEPPKINTTGISESAVAPTRGDYINNQTIIDNIRVFGATAFDDIDFYADSYIADYGVESTFCTDAHASKAGSSSCVYSGSGPEIDCQIGLGAGFSYFEKPMKYYGCMKVGSTWILSQSEYLIIDSVCGDGKIYSNGSDNLAGTIDDENCEQSSDCVPSFGCISCNCTKPGVNTIGLSEVQASPTRGDYINDQTIEDDIRLTPMTAMSDISNYVDSYIGDSNIASTGCTDGHASVAVGTSCVYDGSGLDVDCEITLDAGFSYFEKPMKFYGCLKVSTEWLETPAEYLIIDSLCGDGKVYANGSDNLAGTSDDEECEIDTDCLTPGEECRSCKCLPPLINTTGISESAGSPTIGDFLNDRIIIDNIKLYGATAFDDVDAYADSYLGDSNIQSTGCTDGHASEAADTSCAYSGSGPEVGCQINIAQDFGYFEKPMKYYGCLKVGPSWVESLPEYLLIDSLCGDGKLYTNGTDNLAGTSDDEECDDGNNLAGDGCSVNCKSESFCTEITYDTGSLCLDTGYSAKNPLSDYVTSVNGAVSHAGSTARCGDAGYYSVENSGALVMQTPVVPLDGEYVFTFDYNTGSIGEHAEHFSVECGTKTYTFPDVVISPEQYITKSIKCDFTAGQNPVTFRSTGINKVYIEDFRLYSCDSAALEVHTTGLSEISSSPTEKIYSVNKIIEDDIAITNLGVLTVGNAFLTDYRGNCVNGPAAGTNCIAPGASDTNVNCEIILDSSFNYFDISMLYYGCVEINSIMNMSPAEYLKIMTSCGDSKTSGSEACDDGDTSSGDGCSATCALESMTFCGDGIRQTPNSNGVNEVCDDHNTIDGDGCSSDCLSIDGTSYCGDGTTQNPNDNDQPEVCDDNNAVDGDGCSAICQDENYPSTCGDGKIQRPNTAGIYEDCDDSNTDPGDGCSAVCTVEDGMTFCGDGLTQTPNSNGQNEQCDDHNTIDSDGCSAICILEGGPVFCGDGVVSPGEQCDDNNTIDGDGCSSECVRDTFFTFCGDGHIQHPNSNGLDEECDDHNVLDGDGCSDNCMIELFVGFCGDGSIQAPNFNSQYEECDDGNVIDGDGCSASCTIEAGARTFCGDGKVQTPNSNGVNEVCDDHNTIDGDGCSSDCLTTDGSTYCGDGITQNPNDNGQYEGCDDNNAVSGDGCSDICINENFPSTCGDGVIQRPNSNSQYEECDDSGTSSGDGCSATCTIEAGHTFCGDGVTQSPNDNTQNEACDDGNTINGDGCENCNLVLMTYCGDGTIQSPNSLGIGGMANNGFEQCEQDLDCNIGIGETCQNCACIAPNCILDTVNVILLDTNLDGNATPGEIVRISGNFTASCSSADYIQVDASGGGCAIQWNGGDLLGIGGIISKDGNNFTASWVVPTIDFDCYEKTVTMMDARFWSGDPDGTAVGDLRSAFGSFRFGPDLCGNTFMDSGEECDPLNGGFAAGNCTIACQCTVDHVPYGVEGKCRLPICNYDSIQDGLEECDDGNHNSYDGCIDCIQSTCGDSYIWLGHEDCDDGPGGFCADDCYNRTRLTDLLNKQLVKNKNTYDIQGPVYRGMVRYYLLNHNFVEFDVKNPLIAEESEEYTNYLSPDNCLESIKDGESCIQLWFVSSVYTVDVDLYDLPEDIEVGKASNTRPLNPLDMFVRYNMNDPTRSPDVEESSFFSVRMVPSRQDIIPAGTGVVRSPSNASNMSDWDYINGYVYNLNHQGNWSCINPPYDQMPEELVCE